MCDSCGCTTPHDTGHATKTVDVHQSLLEANTRQAEENRRHFESMGAVAINMISSPGAGKTTLLEHTIEALGADVRIGVIEGDIETERDAVRPLLPLCKRAIMNRRLWFQLDARQGVRAVVESDSCRQPSRLL